MRSRTPDTAFSQKPAHRIGRNRRSSRRGTFGATPRMRKSIAALMPTAKSHPDCVHVQDAGKGEHRWRPDHPLTEQSINHAETNQPP